MYKEHLRHFWNIHATKNRMHVLSCSSQLCACVLTRMSHERSKNIDGTELLKYYFDSAHHTDHHFLSEASALPEFGVAMPDHSEFDYRMRQNGYGIHMNTWTHGNSPSCVLLFPSTMRSCECPERWPIPAPTSQSHRTHPRHLLIRRLSGDSTSREAMDWRMHLWFRGAGGCRRPDEARKLGRTGGPGMMKKSSSGSVYFSSIVHHVSSKFDEFGVSMICWQLADLCFVCQKNLRESNSPCSSQISTSEHPDVQTNYIWHYRTWYCDIIYDYFILYIQCNNCSFHTETCSLPQLKIPSVSHGVTWCHRDHPTSPVTSVSHLQQQIQTAVAKTQTAGVRSIELQRRAGPQCLRLDVVFLMRKIICLSAIREMSKSHLRKGNNMENWEWCFNTIEKCRISKVRG